MKKKTSLAYAWFVVLMASLFFFYQLIEMNMFNSLAHQIEQSFELDAKLVGFISAFYFVTCTLVLYPVGFIVDRVSAKKMILLGMVICIVGMVMIAKANSVLMLTLGRGLTGVSSAFCLLTVLRLASGWFPMNKMAQVTGIVVTFGMFGGVFSQAPLIELISWYGWREALMLLAECGVAMFVLILLFVRDAPANESYIQAEIKSKSVKTGSVSFVGTFLQLVKNPKNWWIGLYISTMNMPIIILGGLFGIDFLMQVHGFTQSQSANVTSMIFVGMIIGSSLFGFLSDYQKTRKRPMFKGAVFALIVCGIILFSENLTYEACLVLFLFQGITCAAQVIGYPVTREINPPHIVGAALGFISILIMGLPIIFEPLAGFLMHLFWEGLVVDGVPVYDWQDYCLGFLSVFLSFIVSIICLYFLPETYPKLEEKK